MSDETTPEDDAKLVQRDSPNLEPIIEPTGPQDENIEPPKKRRGRPPNSSKLLEEKPISEGGTKEKRAYKKKAQYDNSTIENLARQIQGLHFIAVKMSGFKELEISEPESVMLAESVVNVAREYDLALSGKTGALLQLTGVAVMIYLPRLMSINERKAQFIPVAPGPTEKTVN